MIFPEKILCWDHNGKPHMIRNVVAVFYNDLTIHERNKHPLAQCGAALELDRLVAEYELRDL